MAYVDRDQSQQKIVSGAATVLLVGAVGYALVTGLAMSVIHHGRDTVPLVNYPDDTKPPPENPTTPKRIKDDPVARTTPVVVPTQPPVGKIETTFIPVKSFPLFPTGDSDLGGSTIPQAQPSQAVGVKPVGNPGAWVSEDDYPTSALRAGIQGRTGFRLTIGSDGRVSDCAITQSSGSDDLDRTACRLLGKRAHFTSARDDQGNAIPSSYASSVLWRIPTD